MCGSSISALDSYYQLKIQYSKGKSEIWSILFQSGVPNQIQSQFLHEKFTFQFGCGRGAGGKYLLLFKSKVLNSPQEDIYQYTWQKIPKES